MALGGFSTQQRFGAIAALCLAGVAAALVAQHGFDMRPCPWCVLQRAIYLLIAVVCVIGMMVKVPAVRAATVGAVLLLSAAGIASAIYQHVVAAKQFSCNLTMADKVITALRLESLAPSLFGVTATCADAAASVLGMPFEYWSLALFGLLSALALSTLIQPRGV